MKNLIIILSLLITSFSNAQRLEKINDKYELTIEDSIEQKSRDQIFELINKWIKEKFPAQDILTNDSKEGNIAVRGIIRLNDISHLISCVMTDVKLHFIVTILVRQNSYKIIFNDMVITNQTVCHQSNGSPPTSQHFEHPVEKLHLSNKKIKRILIEIENKLLLLAKDIEEYVKRKQN